jgi:peptide deformylase
MTIYNILHYPDPRLHTVAKPVALDSGGVSPEIHTLIQNMFDIMRQAKGIGLAATQIDVHQRLVVIDVSEEGNEPLVLINPEIIWASPEKKKNDEGCLSVPGIYDGVERSVAVKVKTHTVDGGEQIIEAEDLLAICIQHEMDHLMGKVFVEYLSPLKRNRIKTKLLKEAREAARD